MEKTRVDKDGHVEYREFSTDQQSSMEINRTAKGDLTWKIKVYSDNSREIEEKAREYMDIAWRLTGVQDG